MPKYKKYRLLAGANNADEKRFEAGDIITVQDFPREIIDRWLETGRLVEARGEINGNGKDS